MCAWNIWCMFLVQCEGLRINRLTLLLVVTMPYACWVLWRTHYIEDFTWRLRFQSRVALWRVVLRDVYFEGPNCIEGHLKTSILNTWGDSSPGTTSQNFSLPRSPPAAATFGVCVSSFSALFLRISITQWDQLGPFFTPRGHANSLSKRLEILTCDWSKSSNQSRPIYT